MQPILYKKLNDKFSTQVKKAFEELDYQGYSIFNVGEIDKDDFLKLSYSFGEVIPSGRNCELVDDIYTTYEIGNKTLPMHTDKSYWRIPPRFEILYVNGVENMEKGEITVGNLIGAFHNLSEEDQQTLLSYVSVYSAPFNRDQGSTQTHLVGVLDNEIAFFRYRLDIFDSSLPEIKRWIDNINDTIKYVSYKKGDILILDNWRHCAGRNDTVWHDGGYRHLYRSLII